VHEYHTWEVYEVTGGVRAVNKGGARQTQDEGAEREYTKEFLK